MAYTRRLMKELENLKTSPPDGVELVTADDLRLWTVDMSVLDEDNVLYFGQQFRLSFKFPEAYPVEAPSVQFVIAPAREIPMHPHVYSNGHICLDLLGTQWSPVQNVNSICISLQSMLTSNEKCERPPDDERYVRHAPSDPKKTRFYYHDDNV